MNRERNHPDPHPGDETKRGGVEMGEELTIEAKALAVADAHERLLAERPHWATLAEVLRIPLAQRMLEEIDRGLAKFKAEARMLEAERIGSSAGEGSEAVRDSERYRAALDHTRRIEDGFHADLARMGHGDGHTPDVRRQIEEKALAYVRDHHGEPAAEYCRRLLAPEEPDSPLDDLASVPRLP